MSKSQLEQSNHYFQPPLQSPTNPVGMEIQYVHSYGIAAKLKRKYIELVADSIPKGVRMKDLK